MTMSRAQVLSAILKHVATKGVDISVASLDFSSTFLCGWGRAAWCSVLHAHHLRKLRERAELNRALALGD